MKKGVILVNNGVISDKYVLLEEHFSIKIVLSKEHFLSLYPSFQ